MELEAFSDIQKNKKLLAFYEEEGLQQAKAIMDAATLSYRLGEINFVDLSAYLKQAIDLKQGYLNALNDYNQSVIQYNYFIN